MITSSSGSPAQAERVWQRLRKWDEAPNPRWLVGLLTTGIAWITWVPLGVAPGPGLDAGWTASLAMATHSGLTYGRQVVFTFGPLGFLDQGPTMYYRDLAAFGLLYAILLRLLLAYAIYRTTRAQFSTVVAIGVTIVISSIATSFDESALLAVLALRALGEGIDGRRAVWLGTAVGAVCGIESLTKVSIAAPCVLIATILLLCLPGRPWGRLASASVAGVVVLLTCWLVTGQPVSALPSYVHQALEGSIGYSAAMEIEQPIYSWAYAVSLLMLVAGAWAAWVSAGAGTRRRLGSALVWIVVWFFAFKDGMVREDAGHVTLFLGTLMVAWFGLRLAPTQRLLFLASATILAASSLSIQEVSLTQDLHPAKSVSAAVTEARDVISASRSHAQMTAGRNLIAAAYPLDPTTLKLLSGHTMAIFPLDQTIAWAYGLDWRPIPVFQSYTAYTSELDSLDASFLASSAAPQRILLENTATTSIDFRYLGFDEPQTTRAILCRYHTIHTTAAWAVLARVTDQCGHPQLVGTVRVPWGRPVNVPAPGRHSMVYASITGAQVHGLESLQSFFWEPRLRSITLGTTSYRLVEATAGNGLPLRATGGLGAPSPFVLIPDATTVSVNINHTVQPSPLGPQPKSNLTYRFYAVNVHAG